MRAACLSPREGGIEREWERREGRRWREAGREGRKREGGRREGESK